jgi:hypothetical protein
MVSVKVIGCEPPIGTDTRRFFNIIDLLRESCPKRTKDKVQSGHLSAADGGVDE